MDRFSDLQPFGQMVELDSSSSLPLIQVNGIYLAILLEKFVHMGHVLQFFLRHVFYEY